MRKSMENAKIGIFDMDNKGEASQVFEYQNNRGVHASDFEIIRAYLIHQIYVNSGTVESDIDEIQKSISVIYRNLEAVSEHFSEDDHYNKFKAATRYVLWQYDNFLRKKKNLPKLANKKYRTYNTIEHIQPQATGLSYPQAGKLVSSYKLG